MYWFKINPSVCFLAGYLLFSLTSCQPSEPKKNQVNNYFDLKKYLNEEATQLAKRFPQIRKSVSRNGETENKIVTIKNWPAELSLFIESDINKPSWRESYRKEISGNFKIYTALDKSLRTRKIVIKQVNEQMEWILIENYTKNELYSTIEKLSYFPGSHYEIRKEQSVRFLGTNNYVITGWFKNN